MRLKRHIAAAVAVVLAVVAVTFVANRADAVIDGEPATSADGMAAVFINGKYNCSGTIVDNYWVLTARHCLYEGKTRVANSALSVRVKSLYRTEGGGVVLVATSRVRTSNDIALLKLARSANAEPVRLPTKTTYVGATTYAFGWGRRRPDGGDSATLYRATQTVKSFIYTDAYGGQGIETDYGNGGMCFGDSGGPLFKVVDGQRYQVGVLSGVVEGCLGGAVWADVPTSRDWILNIMATV